MKKKRVAVLVEASIYERKGLFNAVYNRCLYLKKIAAYDVDIYLLSSYKGLIASVLSDEKAPDRPDRYDVGDLDYRILWRKKSIIDYILYHKLGRRELFHSKYNKQISILFKDYDLLDIHSGGGETALEVKKRYNIPFIVTWHGSDIHTAPLHDAWTRALTKTILENAYCNCFVSKALKIEAEKLGEIKKSEILYNGVSDSFYTYPVDKRNELRSSYSVEHCKVVAFVGNVIPVKNPESLASIFSIITKLYKSPVKFWVIGDGELRPSVEQQMKQFNVDCVFWGNQPASEMSKYFQCIDVLTVPSRNEGLPLVSAEAIRCGANVVGSKVGGIPEVIGEENCVVLKDGYEHVFAEKAVCFLRHKREQSLPDYINWAVTAEKENSIIMELL